MEVIREMARKYDRTLVAVGMAMATLITVWLATGRSINRLIETSEVVQGLKIVNAKQEILNIQFAKDVGEVKTDIKEILKRMPER